MFCHVKLSPSSLCADIRDQLRLVERGVAQKDPRYISRAVRSLQSLRKRTNDSVLRRLAVAYFPAGRLCEMCVPSRCRHEVHMTLTKSRDESRVIYVI